MRYREITTPDINNGRGFRVTLWISGCSRKCPGCHNQELWDYTLGKRLSACTDELLDKVGYPYIKGLTISGGDPLDQNAESLDDLFHLLSIVKLKYPLKDIWIYSGGKFEDMLKEWQKKKVLMMCDVLVDGPYIDELRDITLPFRGSSNQRIIDIGRSFRLGEVVEYEIE